MKQRWNELQAKFGEEFNGGIEGFHDAPHAGVRSGRQISYAVFRTLRSPAFPFYTSLS